MGPPIWIPTGHTAVIIPLLVIDNPISIAKDKNRVQYNIVWETGSLHYFAEDSILETDGGGRVVFIFQLFKMRDNDGDVKTQDG